VLKKKSNTALQAMSADPSKERARNMKIFNTLEKKHDIAAGGKVNSKVSEDKILKKAKHKDDGRRKKTSGGR